MDELSAKLSAMADLNDELKHLKTKHKMTAKQNAEMFIKLQVWFQICSSTTLRCSQPIRSCHLQLKVRTCVDVPM